MSKALENLRNWKGIKTRLDAGKITQDEAEKLAEPVIKAINEHNVDTAAKNHRPYPKQVTFAEMLA